jgi:hypothetical protein
LEGFLFLKTVVLATPPPFLRRKREIASLKVQTLIVKQASAPAPHRSFFNPPKFEGLKKKERGALARWRRLLREGRSKTEGDKAVSPLI